MEPKGIDDPFNHRAYLGLERAVRELGIRGRVLTPAPKEGYVPSLSLLARQKPEQSRPPCSREAHTLVRVLGRTKLFCTHFHFFAFGCWASMLVSARLLLVRGRYS